MSHRLSQLIKAAIGYAILILVLVVTVFPFWWMAASSFKSRSEMFTFPPSLVPAPFILDNYRALFAERGFATHLGNSLFVSLNSTLASVFLSSLAGFGFAKYDFRYRVPMFTLLLASMMIPFQLLLVPQFIIMTRIGWTDSYWALIVPGLSSAVGVFLMRQFIENVSDELLDAARIDGCSEFGIFLRVVVPVIRPGLGILAIITFMGVWNSFLWPMVVLKTQSKYTVPIVLSQYADVHGMDWGAIMSGSVVATIPMLILFLAMQRQFIAGLTVGAVKE